MALGERYLLWFLRVVGGVTLLAFPAALMPSHWIVEIAEELGFEPFPDSPLTFYLARNLSLLYGFVGCALLLIAADLPRYRPLVRWTAFGTIGFAVLQFACDTMAAMPAWWTWGESGWTLAGGILLWTLDRNTPRSSECAVAE